MIFLKMFFSWKSGIIFFLCVEIIDSGFRAIRYWLIYSADVEEVIIKADFLSSLILQNKVNNKMINESILVSYFYEFK